MMLRVYSNLSDDLVAWILRPTEQCIDIGHLYWIHYMCNTVENCSREPSLRLMVFRFFDLSVSPLPEAFENLVDAVDVTHRSLPTDPINYDGPFERVEVTLRLREDLVGSGRGAPCDKT